MTLWHRVITMRMRRSKKRSRGCSLCRACAPLECCAVERVHCAHGLRGVWLHAWLKDGWITAAWRVVLVCCGCQLPPPLHATKHGLAHRIPFPFVRLTACQQLPPSAAPCPCHVNSAPAPCPPAAGICQELLQVLSIHILHHAAQVAVCQEHLFELHYVGVVAQAELPVVQQLPLDVFGLPWVPALIEE